MLLAVVQHVAALAERPRFARGCCWDHGRGARRPGRPSSSPAPGWARKLRRGSERVRGRCANCLAPRPTSGRPRGGDTSPCGRPQPSHRPSHGRTGSRREARASRSGKASGSADGSASGRSGQHPERPLWIVGHEQEQRPGSGIWPGPTLLPVPQGRDGNAKRLRELVLR